MFKVMCPKCKHDMLYQPMNKGLKGKSKRCVYCGKTFNVYGERTNRVKEIIR